MKIAARIAAAVLVVSASLAGCSTPPGPEPARPAPKLPADAVAYDDLKSTNREFPFARSCDQIPKPALAAMQARKARTIKTATGSGCAVTFATPTLDEIWIEAQDPPNPSEPRFFPLIWNARKTQTYHKRLLLDGRYYAVEVIDFYGGGPGCYLSVDTGSPTAVQFRGILPDKLLKTQPELNSSMTGYKVDHAGIDRFMTEHCPEVERLAIALLGAIDPNGGSLAT